MRNYSSATKQMEKKSRASRNGGKREGARTGIKHENTGLAELRMISRLYHSLMSWSGVNPRIATCAVRIK